MRKSNIINFEEQHYLRTSSAHILWDRLINHCLLTIESCMGEVLPEIEQEENKILKELKRRNDKTSLEVHRAYLSARVITMIELRNVS